MSLSPPPVREDLPVETKNGRLVAVMPRAWIKFFTDIKELLAPVSTGGLLIWTAISKDGSNLTDLRVRNHADLQNVNSSTYTHLTELNATDLTDGGNTILHKHTHNLEDGLQGGTTDEYYHLSLTHHTDLTDGGNTVLHKHTHNLQDSIQGGAADDYYHLTLVQHTDLTDAGNTALHKHTHNDQDGLQGGVAGQYYHLEEQEHHGLLDALGTNLVSGCTLSINADTTKFDIAAGLLYYTDSYTDPLNPVFTAFSYAGSTANIVTNLATQDSTYVSIDKDGVLYQSATKISAGDTRDKVLLGALVHTNRTSITSADSNTNVIGLDVPNCISDISYAMGVISEGNLYSGNVTNTLRLDKSAGYFWQIGINWKNDKKNPNRITAPASTGATHLATWRNGAGGWVTAAKTDIIPGRYDDGTGGATQPSGVLSVNKWQIIKIWYLPNSQLTGVEYGQVVYNNEADAEASKGEPTTDNPALASLPFRGWLLVRGGATNLNDPGDAAFIDAGKFGQLTSGAGTGSSTTTLQGAYDNSTQPQITTSATSGALQVKRGSAADTDAVFEVLNGAGTAVVSVTGERATLTAPALGTPASGTLTNCTGLPIATGVSGLGANVATFLATPSSANLAAAVTDETGSGALVLATSPTLTTPAITGLLDISGATSGQIKFPATQNASADVNTLDDYEEGTFTPTVSFATPGDLSVTYSIQVGSYTKIGRQVTVTAIVNTSAFTYTTASGIFRIVGNPFTAENVTNELWFGASSMSGYTASAAYTSIAARIVANGNVINMSGSGSAIALTNLTTADVPTASTIAIRATVTFFV